MAVDLASPSAAPLPLVVDLDGTLTPTDTLVESALGLVRQRPWMVFALAWWLLTGRSGFKQRVAAHYRLDVGGLPWRQELLEWLQGEKSAGRRVYLATAAHQQIADDVAQRLQIFDGVLSTRDGVNLKGRHKLAAIQQQIAPDFVYAGDSSADLPIWRAARGAVLVAAKPGVARQAAQLTAIEREFRAEPAGIKTWLRAIRVHQWLKNLLLLVPAFTSFSWLEQGRPLPMLLAFLAFSLAASATYVMNDLWDLRNDRLHPRKRKRPFASAQIPLVHAGAVVLLLFALALAAAVQVSWAFVAVLAGYVVLTTAYSWSLKTYVLVDVLMLALLYSYRILAGAVATQIVVSRWLLAFSMFFFLGLALVKRCAELVSLQESGRDAAHGRDYQTRDLAVLWPLGVGASLCAIVVLGLYIGSPEAAAVYRESGGLWLACLVLTYWSARMWIKTGRGEMHDDPIVFALKDRGTRLATIAMVVIPVVAHYLPPF
ncbi:MAG TPA: UbiA family prenyltransferase [Roseateles sp.]